MTIEKGPVTCGDTLMTQPFSPVTQVGRDLVASLETKTKSLLHRPGGETTSSMSPTWDAQKLCPHASECS